MPDQNTQMISDGVSLKVRVKKDRTAAMRERLGWKSAPLHVRGIARLCAALDRQLEGEGRSSGFLPQLEQIVTVRRQLVKKKESGVQRVFDLNAIWKSVQEWAAQQQLNVQEIFSRIMACEGEPGDTLRKSRLFAELPASIAAQVISPELLASTTVFSFDFGLCKWIGGGVVLPTDQGVDANRVVHPYTVRGGEYHHKVGSNKARARREKGNVTPELEAKLRHALECGKTRLFREILRDMRAIADAAHPGRDFIVIVGDGGIGSGRGHRKPATKEWLKFLQEFVLVVRMPEHNTSKCCPRCWSETGFFWDAHRPAQASHRREFRTKWCTSPDCRAGFAYDWDTAAGVNFFRILYSMVQGWGRPSAFEDSNGAFKLSPRAEPTEAQLH